MAAYSSHDRLVETAGRVAVTGLGVISSIGTGPVEFLTALRAGRSSVRPITSFDTAGYAHANACEIVGFEPETWIRNVPLDSLGRASQFSVAAATSALADAGLPIERLRDSECLVAIGTTDGESADLDRLARMEVTAGPAGMDPRLARLVPAHRLSLSIAMELGLRRAEAFTIGTACSAGNYAIGAGFDAIRLGEAEFALCGGADAISRRNFTAFYRLGTIARDVCRPFDRNRDGILTGEGAGVLLLERLSSALARGARIYAEILGYGLSCDAYHPVAPQEESVARCMQLALDDAGVKPNEVDFISAHGTGTKANDVTEVRAIRRVYGDRPPRTVSLKSMLGHTMGAASALAAIACSLAITEGFIPPTINHVETDPDCEIDCVPNRAVDADVRIVQNNGLAFGGNNASVVLARHVEGR